MQPAAAQAPQQPAVHRAESQLALGRRIQITRDPGLEMDAAISPDGKLVAYASGPSGEEKIFVRQIDGGGTIALCGLNPHAGEGGLLGSEEHAVLAPAVAILRSEGIDVAGPLPADTVFVRAVRGEFAAVVAGYHDQGLIPVKLAAFGKAVNVTLGLPFVRTSVDHGTGFDIVEKGIASESSLLEAMRLAVELTSR